jgi:hypothetical protein
VGRQLAADLQHDLGVTAQRDGLWLATLSGQ